MFNNKSAIATAGVMFGGILALAFGAIAEDSELDAGPRMFPYNGYLEFDGAAFNGDVDLRFTVTDGVDCNFEEEHDGVQVYAGRFNANIGAVAGDVPTCVFDAEAVFIQVAVREAESEGEYTALRGQQRIHPVPFAYWAAEASDLKVDGNVNVSGSVIAQGDLVLDGAISDIGGAVAVDDDLVVFGNLRVSNNVAESDVVDEYNDLRLRLFTGDTPQSTYGMGIQDSTMFFNVSNNAKYRFYENGGTVLLDLAEGGSTLNTSLIMNGNFTTNNLRLTGNIADTNSDVTINDNLDITGDIQDPDGNLTINDNLDITGSIRDTNSDVVINDTLTVSGQLNIQDVVFNSNNTQGCMRIATTQYCWGRLSRTQSGTVVNYLKNFGNDSVTVTVTAIDPSSSTTRVSHASSVNRTRFTPRITNKDGNVRTDDFNGISYVAFGLAGSQW